MKKTIAILLVMAVVLGSVFAGIDTTDSTLNLTTTVAEELVGRFFPAGEGVAAPTVASFNNDGGLSEDTFTIASNNLSVQYYYAYKTNLTKAPAVTLTAKPLKHTEVAGVTMAYNVAVAEVGSGYVYGQDKNFSMNFDGLDTDPTSGLRVFSRLFEVSVDESIFTNAPAGKYEGEIVIGISAS